jgi:hypothetical protein
MNDFRNAVPVVQSLPSVYCRGFQVIKLQLESVYLSIR